MKDIKNDPFDEYIKNLPPTRKELGQAWAAAIGLQDVDRLEPSAYLYETARKNIDGKISVDEAGKLIDSYYESKDGRQPEGARTEEADKVSARIAKLLSDKLPANLGYLYENLVAQMIAASGRELYYHTWEKKESTHYYEVDFLISEGSKINAFEIKSSGSGKHESIREFGKKFSQNINKTYLISQKDVGKEENLLLKPFYLMPFLVK